MRYLLTFSLLAAVLCLAAAPQTPISDTPSPALSPAKMVTTVDAPPIVARASASDYQGHAAGGGGVTIAADFTGHSVPTPLASYNDEDYVAVEVALFGAPGAHLKLSRQDFSLRINGKKAIPSAIYLAMYRSIKDPNYVSEADIADKKRIKEEGGVPIVGEDSSDRNPHWHPIPFNIEHQMEVRIEKAALPEGDRALPAAGLVYFPYDGRENRISSVELIYDGTAGRLIVPLHP